MSLHSAGVHTGSRLMARRKRRSSSLTVTSASPLRVVGERQADVRAGDAPAPAGVRFSFDLRTRGGAASPLPRMIARRPSPSVRSNSVSASSSETARPERGQQLAHFARVERQIGGADRRHFAPGDEPGQRWDRRPRPRSHHDVQVLGRALQHVAERLHRRSHRARRDARRRAGARRTRRGRRWR